MRKLSVNIHECTTGMRVAETIYNEYGAVIIAEDTILDEHLINKLNNLDIYQIRIYDQTKNQFVLSSTQVFNAKYNENVEVVKDLLHDISSGKNVDTEKVNTVSESIYTRINENRDIVGCISRIQNVDDYTYTHSMNVSLLSMLIGKWLKCDAARIKQLVQAGLLHDIGKSKIDPQILNKPGRLTSEEFDEMKKHSIYGYRIVSEIPDVDEDVRLGILMHHEREDGSGYPMGIKGHKIHDISKIIAVADIYDAMTSNRTYRQKGSPFDVFDYMEHQTFGILDPRVVNAFLNNIAAYYIGDLVRLNNGDVGEIIYINSRNVSMPIVKVGDTYLDLTIRKDLKIVELL